MSGRVAEISQKMNERNEQHMQKFKQGFRYTNVVTVSTDGKTKRNALNISALDMKP